MSRIFDALRTSRAKRPGFELSGPAAAQDLLQDSERERIAPIELTPSFLCHECRSPMRDDGLFCPKCNAFQGSTISTDWYDEER